MTIAALIIVAYTLVGIAVALVLAYRYALDARLANRATDWEDNGPIFVGIGLLWPLALAFIIVAHAIIRTGRTIDEAATAEAHERLSREEGAR